MVFGFGDRPSLRRDIGPEQQSGGREKQKKTWEAEIKEGFWRRTKEDQRQGRTRRSEKHNEVVG